MLKLPVFKIIPLLESYYIEQIGNERIPFSTYSKINKSIKRLKKSTSDPLKWVYIQTETKKSLVLMKKSGDSNLEIRDLISSRFFISAPCERGSSRPHTYNRHSGWYV